MASVGMLEQRDGAAVGRFATLQHQFMLKITAFEPQGRPEGAPTHCVEGRAPNGTMWIEIGDGWMYQVKKGQAAGAPMFSLSLTDPAFGDGLRMAAFPVNGAEPYRWRLEIDRSRKAEAPAESDAI